MIIIMAPLAHNKFFALCRDDCQADNPETWKPPSNLITDWSQKSIFLLITGKV